MLPLFAVLWVTAESPHFEEISLTSHRMELCGCVKCDVLEMKPLYRSVPTLGGEETPAWKVKLLESRVLSKVIHISDAMYKSVLAVPISIGH